MNISKYATFFHDGTIHTICHKNNRIQIGMESAELEPEWNEDHITLSKFGTISGTLHMNDITGIRIDKQSYAEELKMSHDSSDINHFSVLENKVVLVVAWLNYDPELPERTDLFEIEIEAAEILWKNSPHAFESLRNG